jgi:hypothetical protein
MKRLELSTFVFIAYVSFCFADKYDIQTNVYQKTQYVYSDYVFNGKLRTPEYFFSGVRGGGVDFELDGIHLERFMDLVKVVSNNCSQIASDWYSYETNEMVRFTTLSAVGYSGYNNYTNFVDKLLAFTETDTRTNYWRSLRFIMLPYGTKQETKLALTYEDEVVSNIFVRIRQQANNNVDTNSVNFCNRVLSGEWKREHLQMEAAGAL